MSAQSRSRGRSWSRRTLLSMGLVIAAAATTGAGCKSGDKSDSSQQSGELIVFAAASLTEGFEAIAKDFEAQNPDVHVTLSFAGSQSLRTQIENGAPAHVFASADAKHTDALAEAGLLRDPVVFAQNKLVLAVPADNPAGLKALEDLPSASRIVLGGAAVPAGAYAEQILRRASQDARFGNDFYERAMANVVSRENHVRQVLQKVVLGEADAAIVYATDARAAGKDVRTIEIPDHLNVRASYPIGKVDGSGAGQLGRRFIAFVQSEPGQARLRELGFTSPEAP